MYASSSQSFSGGSFSTSKVKSAYSLLAATIFHTPDSCYLERFLISSQSFLFSQIVIDLAVAGVISLGTGAGFGFFSLCTQLQVLQFWTFLGVISELLASMVELQACPDELGSFQRSRLESLSISEVMKQISEPFWLYLQLFIQIRVRSSLNCLVVEYACCFSLLSIVEMSMGLVMMSKQSGILYSTGFTGLRKGLEFGFLFNWVIIELHMTSSSSLNPPDPYPILKKLPFGFLLGLSSSPYPSTFLLLLLLANICSSPSLLAVSRCLELLD